VTEDSIDSNVKETTVLFEQYRVSDDYWEKNTKIVGMVEVDSFENNRGYHRVVTRHFITVDGTRTLSSERSEIDDGCGTKTDETKNLINLVVTTKIDKIAKNEIVWTERAPMYSSTITH
jgi:hypothetical protein